MSIHSRLDHINDLSRSLSKALERLYIDYSAHLETQPAIGFYAKSLDLSIEIEGYIRDSLWKIQDFYTEDEKSTRFILGLQNERAARLEENLLAWQETLR